MKQLPKKPMDSIALCMSGGGYRAASFHLGAMAYMEKLELLKHVKSVSTVSGGTITGVLYSISAEKGESFDLFFNRLIHLLRTRDLIKEGLAKLKLDGDWESTTKRRNLINAFAEIYDKHFTQRAQFDMLLKEPSKSHLELMVFNGTEFNHGINFRFQNEGKMGNKYVNVKKDIRGELKLADIIAASSCFPGGFEPIGFPGDFIHKDSPGLKELQKEQGTKDIGIMDGGIYDNQGIDAILLSEKRKRKPHDLIIISDVSSEEMHAFEFAESAAFKGFKNRNLSSYLLRIRHAFTMLILVCIAITLGGVLIAYFADFKDSVPTGIGLTLLSLGSLSLVTFLVLRMMLKKRMEVLFSGFRKIIPPFYLQHLKKLDLTDYKIGAYEPLILDRIHSLMLLTQEVFLKQIRRLNYSKVYESDVHDFRRISNLSKELTTKKLKKSLAKLQTLPNCPPHMKAAGSEVINSQLKGIINEAANFGTNLWFTEDDVLNQMLDKLIASGSFNMCFNLLVYVLELKAHREFNEYPDSIKQELKELTEVLISDWEHFNQDPYFLTKSIEEKAIA